MPYKPKGIRPMKGTGAIIINVLPSSTILIPPTFFKAKMDENFFFFPIWCSSKRRIPAP